MWIEEPPDRHLLLKIAMAPVGCRMWESICEVESVYACCVRVGSLSQRELARAQFWMQVQG